jgi:hypothetical protein
VVFRLVRFTIVANVIKASVTFPGQFESFIVLCEGLVGVSDDRAGVTDLSHRMSPL